jgi:hypothetical protein
MSPFFKTYLPNERVSRPGPAACTEEVLARTAHELIEAQLFRQMALGAPFDEQFSRHVVRA